MKVHGFPSLFREKVQNQAACDDRRNLPGDVDADRVHEQEVLRVFLEPHLVDNPPGHRERRNARRADHGVDLLFEEQVQKFREQNTACRVEHECKKPQSQNQKRLRLQELFRLHLRRNRQPQEDRHEICQHLLRRLGKRVQNAALTNQIAEHQKAPHLRLLQKRLAKEVTVMVHSEDDYNAAVDASNILFGNATSEALRKLDEDTLLAVFEGVPQFEISRDVLAEGVKAVDLFVDNAAVFASKGEMRKLVQGGGVSLNKEKLAAFDQVVTTADLLDEKYLLVQRGKKNYYLLIAK